MLAVAGAEAAIGHWHAAVWVVVFDVVMNGYPVMLQRYNRALLHRGDERSTGPSERS